MRPKTITKTDRTPAAKHSIVRMQIVLVIFKIKMTRQTQFKRRACILLGRVLRYPKTSNAFHKTDTQGTWTKWRAHIRSLATVVLTKHPHFHPWVAIVSACNLTPDTSSKIIILVIRYIRVFRVAVGRMRTGVTSATMRTRLPQAKACFRAAMTLISTTNRTTRGNKPKS